MINQFVALPTWLIVRAVLPWLPPAHPWHGKRFSLSFWTEGRSQLTFGFDVTIWLLILTNVLFYFLLWVN